MDCRPTGPLPKSFLQPCLLLLIKEEPGYGYDLVTRLSCSSAIVLAPRRPADVTGGKRMDGRSFESAGSL